MLKNSWASLGLLVPVCVVLITGHCTSEFTAKSPGIPSDEFDSGPGGSFLMECDPGDVAMESTSSKSEEEVAGWGLRSVVRQEPRPKDSDSSAAIPDALCNLPDPGFSLAEGGWSGANSVGVEDTCEVAVKCHKPLTVVICAQAESTAGRFVIVGCEAFGDGGEESQISQCEEHASTLTSQSEIFTYNCLLILDERFQRDHDDDELEDDSIEIAIDPDGAHQKNKKPVDFGESELGQSQDGKDESTQETDDDPAPTEELTPAMEATSDGAVAE